jgi:uncharacterized membrane protein YgcG
VRTERQGSVRDPIDVVLWRRTPRARHSGSRRSACRRRSSSTTSPARCQYCLVSTHCIRFHIVVESLYESLQQVPQGYCYVYTAAPPLPMATATITVITTPTLDGRGCPILITTRRVLREVQNPYRRTKCRGQGGGGVGGGGGGSSGGSTSRK